jgi:hypothetical protein
VPGVRDASPLADGRALGPGDAESPVEVDGPKPLQPGQDLSSVGFRVRALGVSGPPRGLGALVRPLTFAEGPPAGRGVVAARGSVLAASGDGPLDVLDAVSLGAGWAVAGAGVAHVYPADKAAPLRSRSPHLVPRPRRAVRGAPPVLGEHRRDLLDELREPRRLPVEVERMVAPAGEDLPRQPLGQRGQLPGPPRSGSGERLGERTLPRQKLASPISPNIRASSDT